MPSLTGSPFSCVEGFPPLHPGPNRRSDGAQRLLDLVAGTMLLVASLPVILLAMLAVKITSRGPAIYTQVRLGRLGRPYSIYKIRSMTHNCEARSGVQWSTKGDMRVTPVGRVLRKLHIDELPQLLNVLRGQMSLVGPRPERPEIVESLEKAIPHYRQRLAVRPGLTGLAQVQLPPDTDVESVRRKLRYDQYFVRTGSVWMDIRILVATAIYVVGLPFGVSRVLLGLPGQPEVEPERVGRRLGRRPQANIDTAVEPAFPLLNEVVVDATRA